MIEPTTPDQKSRVRLLYRRALQKGDIVRSDVCERCGKRAGSPGLHGHHHNGYADEHALDVLWLCLTCHLQTHRTTPMKREPIVSPLLTIKEAAAYLNKPEETLRKWRAQGAGPPVAKLGRHLRYRKDALDQWVRKQEEGN